MCLSANCFAAAILVALCAERVEARLFAYTYGAGCCVDHYHYFCCSRGRITPGGGYCEYRGYFMPRNCNSSLYSLYDCWCRPRWHVSPGYSACDSEDDCSSRWGGLHQGMRRCRRALKHGKDHAKCCLLPKQARARAGSRLVSPSHHAVAGGTGHLYDLLFEMPAGSCGDRSNPEGSADFPGGVRSAPAREWALGRPTYSVRPPVPTLVQPEAFKPQPPASE